MRTATESAIYYAGLGYVGLVRVDDYCAECGEPIIYDGDDWQHADPSTPDCFLIRA